MTYKKRPKNKQELSPKSGFRPKKELPTKTLVEFGFTTRDGVKHKNLSGRLKITEEGDIQCLVRDSEGKWRNVKGKLDFIRMKTIVIKEKKK
jgi:hypothetical protein